MDQAEPVGNVPQSSEPFGNVPKPSASFGSVPNDSEPFRTVPHVAERRENYSLTVREVARRFEAAGVARTERSIVNWCQPNKDGVSRLDCYFDPNERKYFITPQSVERAIAEEQARTTRAPEPSAGFGNVPKATEAPKESEIPKSAESSKFKSLEPELMDLMITNKGKDYLIAQLRQEREGFAVERERYVVQLIESSRKVGELETRLLQLEAPKTTAKPDDPPAESVA